MFERDDSAKTNILCAVLLISVILSYFMREHVDGKYCFLIVTNDTKCEVS